MALIICFIALRVEKGNKDVTGTFHFSNTEMYTKYTMCRKLLIITRTVLGKIKYLFAVEMMAKILNVNIDHIKPQNEVPNSAASKCWKQLVSSAMPFKLTFYFA